MKFSSLLLIYFYLEQWAWTALYMKPEILVLPVSQVDSSRPQQCGIPSLWGPHVIEVLS